MRKIRYFLMILCLAAGLFTGLSVSAEESYVYDQVELMTEAERLELHAKAMKLTEDWELNFVAVTTDDADGKTTQEYADDFYDELFPGEDGILYLIDMDHREIYVSTSGLGIRYLTDERIEKVLDAAYPYVSDGDYYMAFVEGMNRTQDFLREGIPLDQYNYQVETGERDYYTDSYEQPKEITKVEFLAALVSGLAAAAVTMGVIKAKYQLKFEDFHYDAYTDSDVRLSRKSDRLVNTFVTHRRIPRNDGNHGGGSSGGGSRSSVHTSSSGSSHGGGGRKF